MQQQQQQGGGQPLYTMPQMGHAIPGQQQQYIQLAQQSAGQHTQAFTSKSLYRVGVEWGFVETVGIPVWSRG